MQLQDEVGVTAKAKLWTGRVITVFGIGIDCRRCINANFRFADHPANDCDRLGPRNALETEDALQ